MGRNSYFEWLIGLFNNPDIWEFSTALEEMFRTEFYPKISLDDNRLDDVRVYLRERYLNDGGDENDFIHRPISILEVLMATCMRYCESVGDNFNGDELPTWSDIVIEAMENMGIIPNFDNENILYNEYDGRNLTNDLRDILHKFNNRTYSEDGHGGPFPLGRYTNSTTVHYEPKEFIERQRDLDLYHLLNLYIGEKIDFYA